MERHRKCDTTKYKKRHAREVENRNQRNTRMASRRRPLIEEREKRRWWHWIFPWLRKWHVPQVSES